MYKISLIIPIYNAERYLEETLNSVLEQTIGHEKIEVIMIDDNSNDHSRSIIKIYADKYSNFILVEPKQKLRSAGLARNLGLENAHGEYIMFLDSDDILQKDACETLYKKVTNNNLELVIGNFEYFDEKIGVWDCNGYSKEIFKDTQFTLDSMDKNFPLIKSIVWNKIYKRDIIEKNNIKFPACYMEDMSFTHMYLFFCKNIAYIADSIYFYRKRGYSENDKSLSDGKGIEFFHKVLEGNQAACEVYKKYNHYQDLYVYLYYKQLISFIFQICDAAYLENSEIMKVIKTANWYFKIAKEFNLFVYNNQLDEIVTDIINQDYDNALINIEELSKQRAKLTRTQKELLPEHYLIIKYKNE